MKKFTRILAVFMAAVIAMTAMCISAGAADYSWTGTWSTNWNDMKLTQSGSKVTGTYEFSGGKISGTVSGNTLTGTWTQTNGRQGKFKFVMSSDGKSFTGSYGYNNDSPNTAGWDGKRKTSVTYTQTQSTSSSETMLKIYLEEGESLKIGALVNGKNASSVKYSSSNSKIAKVSSKGKVKAVSAGTAVISVKSGSTTIKVQIVVEEDD